MKKIFIFLLAAFTVMACEQWNPGNNSDEEKKGPELDREKVSFSFSMPAYQQQTLSESKNKQFQRSASNYTVDQIMIGELTVTNKATNQTEKHSWSIYLNPNDFLVQSNKTIVLDVGPHDLQLALAKGNQQYIGSVSNFNIVDGTNDVPMTIRPVIGDTITDVTLLNNVGTIQFQYDKAELAKFTAPKLGIAIDGGAETIYAIDPATGLISNYFNLPEGEHTVVLKLYDGDTQLGKSNPAQETFNVILGNSITIDLIPLEGETSFTLTENGSNAKFKLNLPTALVTEAGGKENLEALMSIVGPKNPIRELTLTVNSELDASGDTVYFAETTLDNYHYDTVSYTVTFSDLSKTPKEELAKCVQENVILNKDGNTTPCSITMQRAGIATGNLYGTLAINVLNSSSEPLPGVKIKANDQLIGITGAGTFGAPGYLKYRIIKGNYKIKAEDIGTVEKDVTVDALETQNIDLTLSQNLTWKFIDGDGANGINKDPAQTASTPRLAVFNNKIYSIWDEFNSTSKQIRAAVYNSDDASPSWSFIDGDGANGLNKDSNQAAYNPKVAVINDKLYAVWHEHNGTSYQVRVAVYNSNDISPSWSLVDGDGVNGLNKNIAMSASSVQLIAFNNKLYIAWTEHNGVAYQIRMAVYNGDDSLPSWTFIDGDGTNGINHDSSHDAKLPEMTVFNNKLYVIWKEANGIQDQIRVAVYNGNDLAPSWRFIDGDGTNGINKNPDKNGMHSQLVVANGKLYAAWSEGITGSLYDIRIAVYSGDDSSPSWNFVDVNPTPALEEDGRNIKLTVFNNRLHFIRRIKNPDEQWISVAVYNNDDSAPYWRLVNGMNRKGINRDSTQIAAWPHFIVLNNKLYTTWNESNGTASQIRMAVASYQ